MTLIAAVRDYIVKMLNDVGGIKVLVVDEHTLSIVSLVLSQSDILHKEVFLVERVDDFTNKDAMGHLKAVCFLRPVEANIRHLKRHLGSPRFGEYHLFFSNILATTSIHILADADESCVVKEVQEYYGDYQAVDPYHFTVSAKNNYAAYLPLSSESSGVQQLCERSVEAITAVFLSLKKRPLIRYQKTSEISRRIAQDAGKVMYELEKPLFDFRRTDSAPLLLVIDRRDDPVSPLLNQWTYQAMVHELIGIHENRVDLRHVPNISQEQQEVVLSSVQDETFQRNMYDNFGDVGSNVATMVGELQQKDRKNKKIESLEDMSAVLEAYPEYRLQAGNTAKHLILMSELQRVVDSRRLMAVSQTEQELACASSQVAAFEAVVCQLGTEGVSDVDHLRVVLLYALRYEKESPRQLEQLMARLSAKIRSSSNTKYPPKMVHTLLRQCGVEKRTGDLYGNKDIFNSLARNVKRGLQGVENVYTQHHPLLTQTIESATKGRLRDIDYPFVGEHFQQGRPQEVVIFIVGGTTYEEARVVALHNGSNSGVRVLLGGTAVLNSTKFLSDMLEVHKEEERMGRDV